VPLQPRSIATKAEGRLALSLGRSGQTALVTSTRRLVATCALAMFLTAACGGSSTDQRPAAGSDASKSPSLAPPTGAPQDPAMALTGSPPSLAEFNHAQRLCNGQAAQAVAGSGTLSQPHALTAQSVAAYMQARGINPAPWSTVAPQEFVAECDYVTGTDPPATCFGPGSALITDRVAVDDAGRHSTYPPQQCPVTSDGE
jgi:hypothetical protein